MHQDYLESSEIDSESKAVLLSVIIAAYNVGLFLEDCISSVIGQIDPPMYEIVCVDDGSDDNVPSIVAEYATEYPNLFSYIRQENRGLYEARKTGLRGARGEYCVFLDGDDMLAPTALHSIAEYLSKKPVDIVSFLCCRNTKFCEDDFSRQLRVPQDYGEHPSIKSLRDLVLVEDTFNNAALKVIRKSCLRDLIAEKEQVRLNMAEDKLITAKALTNASSCGVLNEILYYYRESDASVTRGSFSLVRSEDLRYVYRKMLEYYSQWGSSVPVGKLHALFLRQMSLQASLLMGAPLKVGDKKRLVTEMVDNPEFKMAYCSEGLRYLGKVRKHMVVLMANRRVIALSTITHISSIITHRSN